MLGNIYNDEKLAYDGDGFWTPFNDGKPYQYWCIIQEMNDMILMVPIVFDVVDDFPVTEANLFPYQVSHWAGNLTLLLGFGVWRHKDEVESLPTFQLNPEIAHAGYLKLAKMVRG